MNGAADHELFCGLDAELPERLAVGQGSVLILDGWCFHPRSRVARLRVLVDGVAHRVGVARLARPDVFAAHHPQRDPRGYSYASGFSAWVPFSRDERSRRADVSLEATLRDGGTVSRKLGVVQLVAGKAPAPDAPAPGARVAICMTACNPPLALFERQVESIREQTLRDWTCLISDDCSDPQAFEGIGRIVGDDPRFRLFQTPRRLGFYDNFAHVLARVPAGAEFVALSDHDDRWHPDKLETLLSAFQPDTLLAYSDMNIIDTQGRLLSDTYWTTRPNRYDSLASLVMTNTVTGAASMFRAGLLEQALPFPPNLPRAFHDHWLACLALAMGRLSYVDRPLYDYVQHSANVLGHYAPARARGWADIRQRVRRFASREAASRLRATLSSWRLVFYGELHKAQLIARILQLRCATSLTPAKARTLRRLSRLDESWATAAWLAGRRLKGLGRVTETLKGESVLLRGVAWRLYAGVRPRLGPPRSRTPLNL